MATENYNWNVFVSVSFYFHDGMSKQIFLNSRINEINKQKLNWNFKISGLAEVFKLRYVNIALEEETQEKLETPLEEIIQ